MNQNGGKNLHVDVLKVQHHVAEFNIDEEFCRRITARHYVFCGNGEHENPDLDVVDAILNSRLGD
jgi:beta-lactamase superfamily II metal-dependent hydrolase